MSISNQIEILETLNIHGNELRQKDRTTIIGLIDHPMHALQYYLIGDYLTDKDDLQLEGMFKGKLPRAERELRENIVVRTKVSINT